MTNTLGLRASTDRKTTPSANAAGTVANIHNAFGLLSGAANSCPGQTSACRDVCYAGRLESAYTGFRNVMTNNWLAVKDASYADLVASLDSLVKDFIVAADKRKCARVFRIHHDGDFFSRTYASAWARVIRNNPSVTFWAYTRSFVPACNVVDILVGIPNLALYLSVDAGNAAHAMAIRAEYPTGVRIATLTDTFANGKGLMSDLGLTRPGAACPELKGALPLIDKNGGACVTCGLCVTGKADIRFASKGK